MRGEGVETSGTMVTSLALDGGSRLALAAAQLIDAVASGNLTDPRAERMAVILFVEHRVQFQKNFRRGIFGVFGAPKESSADLQHLLVMRGVKRTDTSGQVCSA